MKIILDHDTPAGTYTLVADQPVPVPIDCVLSDWSTWTPTGEWSECVAGQQTRPEERTRTVVTTPANGGAVCGPLAEVRTVTQSCTVIPPATEDVVLIGAAEASQQWRIGPPERVSRGALDTAIAATPQWTTFANTDEQFSTSQNGQRVTTFVKLPVWGNMNGLYNQIPLEGGPLYNGHQFDFTAILEHMKTYPSRPGKRGQAITSPYTQYHGHTRRNDVGVLVNDPRIPVYIGIQVDGVVVYLMRDGSVQHPFKIPGTKFCSDFAFSEVERGKFYVADTLNGRILKVDRQGWIVSVFATGFIKPTSLREVNGVLYVVDNGDNEVYKLAVDGTKTQVALISGAFWIDHKSTGELVVASLSGNVYFIDPVTSVVTSTFPQGGHPMSWVTLSVDRNGTIGPKDEWTLGGPGGAGNTDVWRFEDGVAKLKWTPATALGINQLGNVGFCQDPVGHYIWANEHHPDDAILLVFGLADIFPSLIAVRPSNFAIEDNYDHNAASAGKTIIALGTSPSVPVGVRPSYTCFMATTLWSLVGCTPDSIAEKTFAEQMVFLQNGMLGGIARPELKGRYLYNLMYYINRNSQRFLREGKFHMDALKAFCQPMFGQEDSAIVQRFPQTETDIQVEIIVQGDNLVVKGKDKWNFDKPLLSTLAIKILIDEVEVATLTSPWIMPKPVLAVGQHSLRPLTGLANYPDRATIITVA